jgi:hypothetical protein
VYVAAEETGTIGFVFARDETHALCLLTLQLLPDRYGEWHAVVDRVVRPDGGRTCVSFEHARGATFVLRRRSA